MLSRASSIDHSLSVYFSASLVEHCSVLYALSKAWRENVIFQRDDVRAKDFTILTHDLSSLFFSFKSMILEDRNIASCISLLCLRAAYTASEWRCMPMIVVILGLH